MSWYKKSLALALLAGSVSASAEMVAVVQNGCDKWGYAGHFNTLTQPWNGSPFVIETEFKFTPNGEKTVALPRDSWAGIFVQDSQNGTRYVAIAANHDFTGAAERLSLQLLSYEQLGDINWREGEPPVVIPATSDWLNMRLAYDGRELVYSWRENDTWREIGRWTPPEGFKPDQIGLNVDAYHPEAPGAVTFARFELTGEGPARSDDFSMAGQIDWQADAVRGDWQFPTALALSWRDNVETSEAFERGSEPYFLLQLESTEHIGATAALSWVLRDYQDRELATGDGRQELTGRFTESTVRLPAQQRNGIYKLQLTATLPDGTKKELPLQFAVIPPRSVTAGVTDATSPYLLSNAGDLALFARIGMRLFRGPHWSTETVSSEMTRIAEQGMLWGGTFVGFGGPETPEYLAQRTGEICDAFVRLKQEKPELVQFIELFNEPENWPPTGLNTDLWPFALQVADCFARLHREIPGVKLMNGGTTHRNYDFLRKLALSGMSDPARMPDIVAVHGYRSPTAPEFGHEEDVAAIRALFGDRPIWDNEDAYFVEGTVSADPPTITSPTATILESTEITQAAYLVRTMLAQLAAGYAVVCQFDGIPNHSVMLGRFHHRPALVTLAVLTDMLPHPKLQGRRTAMTDNLWALDWESDGEAVTTVWTLNRPEAVTVTGDGIVIYDAFGNPLEANAFVAGGMPHYIKGANIALERQATDRLPVWPLTQEKLPEHLGLTLATGGRAIAMDQAEVWVEVGNPGIERRTGVIRPHFMNNAPEAWHFTPAAAEFALEPGETARLVFTPGGAEFNPLAPKPEVGYAALWWSDGYRIAVELESAGATELVPQKRSLALRGIPYLAACEIDADPAEWAQVPVFEQMGAMKRNVGLSMFWNGKADYCPTFRLAWTDQGLLLLAEVIDDKHDASELGLNAWRTDSVQLGITPDRERISFTDYPVITLATSGPAVLQRDTESRRAGELPEVKLATRRVKGSYEQDGVTWYEALIPWSVIGNAGQAGETIGFSLLFNESDGYWRKGWEGYFMQMGGQIVDPRQFADLTLLK